LKDFWESLVAATRDRTTNPLTFSFALSWTLSNYRFFAVLLSEGPVKERLQQISEMYPCTWETYAGRALLVPFVLSLIYVFAYPYVARWVITFSRQRQVTLANELKGIEGKRLLTEDESIARTRMHEKDLKRLKDDLAQANSKSEQLSAALAAAELQLATSKSQEAPAGALTQAALAAVVPDYSVSNPVLTENLKGVS